MARLSRRDARAAKGTMLLLLVCFLSVRAQNRPAPSPSATAPTSPPPTGPSSSPPPRAAPSAPTPPPESPTPRPGPTSPQGPEQSQPPSTETPSTPQEPGTSSPSLPYPPPPSDVPPPPPETMWVSISGGSDMGTSGLSIGANVGIAFAVIVGAILLGGASFLVCKRRENQRRAAWSRGTSDHN